MHARIRSMTAIVALSTLLSSCGDTSDPAPAHVEAQAGVISGSLQAQGKHPYEASVQQLYIAYFGRPADVSGLANFEAALAAINAPADIQQLVAAYGKNSELRTLIDTFGLSDESRRLYGTDTTAFLTAVYANVLGRAPDTEGLNYWRDAIERQGLSKGNAALAIMAAALVNTTPQGRLDAVTVNKKVQAGTDFTAALVAQQLGSAYDGDAAASKARTVLKSITNSTSSEVIAQSIQSVLAEWSNMARISKLVNSGGHTLAIDTTGRLWVWGGNGTGEFGDGSAGQVSTVPYLVGSGFVDICAGDGVTGGIKNDGSLWMWGTNPYGGVAVKPRFTGNPLDSYVMVPTLVGTGFIKCSSNALTTLALKADGTVWGWGLNNGAHLGISDTTPYVPVQLESGYANISAGWGGGAAGVKTDGSLWIWGTLSYGNNVIYDSRTPKQIGTGFQSVALGQCTVFGLKPDGTLWKWGCDIWGPPAEPIKWVQIGSGFKEISPVANTMGGVKRDGSLWV